MVSKANLTYNTTTRSKTLVRKKKKKTEKEKCEQKNPNHIH